MNSTRNYFSNSFGDSEFNFFNQTSIKLNNLTFFFLFKFHKVRVHHNEMYADEEVVIDADQNYAMTIVSQIHGRGRPSINLHDLQMVLTFYTLCNW